MPELTRQANPISYIVTSPSLAPFFLAAGTNDRLVPCQQTTVLAEALRRHAGQVELHVLEGALHADRRFEEEMTAPAISWLAGLRTRAT